RRGLDQTVGNAAREIGGVANNVGKESTKFISDAKRETEKGLKATEEALEIYSACGWQDAPVQFEDPDQKPKRLVLRKKSGPVILGFTILFKICFTAFICFKANKSPIYDVGWVCKFSRN